MSDASPSPGRREPWPLLIAAMLGTMIAISLTFFAIAVTHPDAEVKRVDDARPRAEGLHVPRVATDPPHVSSGAGAP